VYHTQHRTFCFLAFIIPPALLKQVLDIQRAISARQNNFVFEGTTMQLKWSAWCAITMNPGYAGRSELPDNLKVSFDSLFTIGVSVGGCAGVWNDLLEVGGRDGLNVVLPGYCWRACAVYRSINKAVSLYGAELVLQGHRKISWIETRMKPLRNIVWL